MFLPLIILLSSVTGFAVAWIATGGLTVSGGNPLVSVLVAFAIALFWGRGFIVLERAYLAGRFDKVRRGLRVWGRSMGADEAVLLRLQMAVDERDEAEVHRVQTAAARIGLGAFVDAFTPALKARLEIGAEEAARIVREGADTTKGLNLAELLLHGALFELQAFSETPGEDQLDRLRPVLDRINTAGQILDETGRGAAGPRRIGYVLLLHRAARAFVYLTQGRERQAGARFDEVIRRGRNQGTLRARYLAQLLLIERLVIVDRLQGAAEFEAEYAKLSNTIRLPGLRRRLSEVHAQVEAEHAAKTKLDVPARMQAAAGADFDAPLPMGGGAQGARAGVTTGKAKPDISASGAGDGTAGFDAPLPMTDDVEDGPEASGPTLAFDHEAESPEG